MKEKVPTTVDLVGQARRLMGTTQIRTIRLQELNANHSFFTSGHEDQVREALTVDVTTTAKAHFKNKNVVVLTIFKLTARRDSTKKPEVTIGASFELRYSLPEEIKPDLAELDSFANTNAMLNVWPYWREIVQNTAVRMNLPPLTLPLYRLAAVNPVQESKVVKKSPTSKRKLAK